MAGIIEAIRRSTNRSQWRNSQDDNSERIYDITDKNMADSLQKMIDLTDKRIRWMKAWITILWIAIAVSLVNVFLLII